MGLLNLFGGDKQQSTQNTSTVTNTQLAGGDIQGNAVYGNRNILVQTDQGALTAAADISRAAIELGRDSIASGESVNIAGLDNATRQLQNSLDFNSRSIDKFVDYADNTTRGAFGFSADNLAASYDFSSGIGNKAFSFVEDVLQQNTGVVKDSLAGNAALARQVSQSSQQSINDSVVKLATIAALAIAAIFVFRR